MTNVAQAEETIFSAARQIADANNRTAYLAQTCAGDEALRARVEALLQVHDEQLASFSLPPPRNRPPSTCPSSSNCLPAR